MGVPVRMTEWADAHDLVVAEADEEIHKQVQETANLARATWAHVNLHMTDWVTFQQEDPILKTMIELISNQKVQDVKHLLGDDANTEEGTRKPEGLWHSWHYERNLWLYQIIAILTFIATISYLNWFTQNITYLITPFNIHMPLAEGINIAQRWAKI